LNNVYLTSLPAYDMTTMRFLNLPPCIYLNRFYIKLTYDDPYDFQMLTRTISVIQVETIACSLNDYRAA